MTWRKAWSLPAADLATLATVAPRLLAARAALTTLPYQTVRRLYARPVRPSAMTSGRIRRTLWAVRAGRRLLGSRPCLAQALVAERMLRKAGTSPELQIGAARADDGSLQAHAWVLCDGDIVVGGRGSRHRFRTFEPLSAPKAQASQAAGA